MATHEIDVDWEDIWDEIKQENDEQTTIPLGFKSIRELSDEWEKTDAVVRRIIKKGMEQGKYERIERLINRKNTKFYRPIPSEFQ
jgi:hypothetical protein